MGYEVQLERRMEKESPTRRSDRYNAGGESSSLRKLEVSESR
jgi:hypothetical protein